MKVKNESQITTTSVPFSVTKKGKAVKNRL